MRRLLLLGALTVASLWLATGALAAPPWESASAARLALSNAEAEVILGDADAVRVEVGAARGAVEAVLAGRPAELAAARAALADAEAAAARLDAPALSAARAAIWTTILRTSFAHALEATRQGDLAQARAWLLVREFRPPTRFTRAAADGTLALDRLDAGALTPAAAAAAVRRDLLDTYDGRLRSTLAALDEAHRLGFATSRAEAGALALGYWGILGTSYRAQRGERAWRESGRPCAVPRRASKASGRHRSRRRRRCVAPVSSTASSASCRSSTGAG